MMYDVVCVRKSKPYLMDEAVAEVVKQVNHILNIGHKGKKGWRPQGGISTTTNEYYVFASQAVVNDEYKESDGRLL